MPGAPDERLVAIARTFGELLLMRHVEVMADLDDAKAEVMYETAKSNCQGTIST